MLRAAPEVINNADKLREVLRLESGAIERAAAALDAEQAEAALSLLYDCAGKTVVTGVGKSGVIGQKIAQTLISTGTVAVYVHPSDALHGGLGIVSPGDVVIALSNSGETDELLAMLPTLKQRGVSMIAIVGKVDSTLGRAADVVLDASVDAEACPLNLAPTASTTVSLAIGDALAMVLMEKKGLTETDFAANHPAGQLGKRLTIRVVDLMHPSPNIGPDAGWLDVVRAISKHALGAVNVVAGDGKLLGIVTDGDLRRTVEQTQVAELAGLTATSMMTASPITVAGDLLAVDALKLMEDRPSQISVLPVVDSEKCVGLIRLHDIARAGL
ncbi:MAG: KpsF/GutQ family sugar-phosphate isomerase [Chloracidobacterium sp.]|nr:KpsF/GutQ family sugar-phosphate isomerase [Chloracidobacterium sp.]